jgi:dipeptidyl aminopeptidase/acylaminoacyl peptidase
MRIFAFTVLVAAWVAVQAPARAADLAGGWKGVWTKDGDALPVTMSFVKTGETYFGAFDSDALQAADIPIGQVSDSGGKVHFEVKGDQTTTVFDGTIVGDALSGAFVDRDAKGSFAFTRARLPAAPARTRDVIFQDKDVTLAGTLVSPFAAGKHPAVLFLHGSGPEGRWANGYLARKFSAAGIVALIYDKRGVGKSTGDWRTVGFEALADDAAAGIRFLRAQPDVDPARVGIYGHSQGATLAPLVAQRAGDLAFVIASAAGGIDPAEVETYSVENSVGMAALAPAEQADARSYIRALIDAAYRGKDRAPLDAMAARFKARDWYFDPPPADNSYWAISRQIAAFNPTQSWRWVHAPVLLVYGAHDERVPPRESIDAIHAALKAGGDENVTVRTYADADHTFTIVDPPRKGGWPKHEPDYADMLTDWILARR